MGNKGRWEDGAGWKVRKALPQALQQEPTGLLLLLWFSDPSLQASWPLCLRFALASLKYWPVIFAFHSSIDSSSAETLLLLWSKLVEQEPGTPEVKGNRNSECPFRSRWLLLNTGWKLPRGEVGSAALPISQGNPSYSSWSLQFTKCFSLQRLLTGGRGRRNKRSRVA